MQHVLSLAITMLLLASLAAAQGLGKDDGTPRKRFRDNRAALDRIRENGLPPLAYAPLPLGAIKPLGWLKTQLEVQRDGLTGHLDLFWNDVKDSGWIGGEAEGWERMPYWLDGALPLAWLLDDAAMKERITGYLDYVLTHQQEDGWLGPQQSTSRSGRYKPRDPWPVFVMLKVLWQYESATGDPRVVPAMVKFLHRLDAQMDERPLFDWNKSRWEELVLVCHRLHDRTGEDWLLDLAEKAQDQGYDWLAHFEDLPYKDKVDKWEQTSHVVNHAMATKAPALWHRHAGYPAEATWAAVETLDRYHGQPNGMFSGDECLAGRNPSQGTELCAVVEQLFSLEECLSITGDLRFADRLELIAFNALPATFKPDMWAHQYVQQANQAVCTVSEERIYTTNGPDSNLYGLEPNYGCCTANLHQGWPKFAARCWMRAQDGALTALIPVPSQVTLEVEGTPVTVALETEYPFRNTMTLRVTAEKAVNLPVAVRIPGTAKLVRIEGGEAEERDGFVRFDGPWDGTSACTLVLEPQVRVATGFNGAVSIYRGSLLFAYEPGESWKYLRGEEPHADWEVFPTKQWNYAVAPDSVTFQEAAMPAEGSPFAPDHAPVTAEVTARLLPEWLLHRNAAAEPPQSPVASEQPEKTLPLIPYGCTNLRISVFPVLE